MISRIGKDEAVSLKENCSEASGFCSGIWVAIEEQVEDGLKKVEDGLKNVEDGLKIA